MIHKRNKRSVLLILIQTRLMQWSENGEPTHAAAQYMSSRRVSQGARKPAHAHAQDTTNCSATNEKRFGPRAILIRTVASAR